MSKGSATLRLNRTLLGLGLIGSLCLALPARAATLTTILDFGALYGIRPVAGLIVDSAGALYGTTPAPFATVFKLTPNGDGTYAEIVLHQFTGPDGDNPQAGLIMDSSGVLYGTTAAGGANQKGTVFKLTPNGDGTYAESILHNFGRYSGDGVDPVAGLVMDANSVLYGTTSAGGLNGHGTVFEIKQSRDGSHREQVLYSFAGGTGDGAQPLAALVIDAKGALYGTTAAGGASQSGTVFKLTPNGDGTYTETLPHSFAGSPDDGATTSAGLLMGGKGNLYGTTEFGGS